MEEYQEVGKSLQDLVEGQERIGATMEWRWGLEKENKKEESGDNAGGSEAGLRESQEGRTPSSVFC